MSVVAIKEQVTQALDELNEAELKEVAEYVAFLRFRARHTPGVDTKQLAALYAEFADEDQHLADEGMEAYHDSLHAEDAA